VRNEATKVTIKMKNLKLIAFILISILLITSCDDDAPNNATVVGMWTTPTAIEIDILLIEEPNQTSGVLAWLVVMGGWPVQDALLFLDS
jgi:hypothetical protein